ncbi:hypothetical protein KVR01_012241 [Diaporthe batatas]|uniref:uncharacterized protein n=1 Tax=Diaporthe batatas TaxID=748121 RepID=UPI001D05B72D|nr:uncharacterized protein KVR01_012241 [Diaporthe batatas]KAG8157969.1 hypothetical protein KVR01_012241 [Diaporthe batatas]
MPRLENILEGLTKAHQRELGYLPASEDEPKSLKAALNTLQYAHCQRQVAAEKFGRYPNFGTLSSSTTEPIPLHSLCLSDNGTEMLELPCNHAFAAKALSDMLSHGQHATIESWGCPVCRQGQIKAAHYGEVQSNLKAVSGGAVHDLQNALFWNVCSAVDDDFWDGPATQIAPFGQYSDSFPPPSRPF